LINSNNDQLKHPVCGFITFQTIEGQKVAISEFSKLQQFDDY